MTRWQLIVLAVKILCRLFFRRDISAVVDIFAPKVEPVATPAQPATLTTPRKSYDVYRSRLLSTGILVLAFVGYAGAAGYFNAYDGVTRLNKRISGGVGIDIANGTIAATGVAVPISIQPWSNISTASRGNLAPNSIVAAFANYTGVNRVTDAQLAAGLATKSPIFENMTTLQRFGAGPTYNGLPIGTGGTAGVTTFNARSGNVLPATNDYSIGQISGAAAVAASGSYTDLSNKPTLATVAGTGAYSDLTGKPSLATVATSGSYNDLSNKPAPYTLPTSTTTVLGGVKVDGTSVVIDGAGVISSTVSAGVASVNGYTGVVSLDSADVGAKSLLAFNNFSSQQSTQDAAQDAAISAKADTSSLGTAAYTPATDYATAAQGVLAGTALQPTGVTAGTITDTDTVAFARSGGFLSSAWSAIKTSIKNFLGLPISIKEYGASCDGSTDDTAALNAAIAALPVRGGVVRIPDAQCNVSTAASAFTITNKTFGLKGEGIGKSMLYFTNSANGGFNITSNSDANHIQFEDLSLVSHGTGGTAITVDMSGQNSGGNVMDREKIRAYFRNVDIRGSVFNYGWDSGIHLTNVLNASMDTVSFSGYRLGINYPTSYVSSYGIKADGDYNPVQFNMRNLTIAAAQKGIWITGNSAGNNMEGSSLEQSNLLWCNYGVYYDVPGNEAQLNIINNHMNTYAQNIYAKGAANAHVAHNVFFKISDGPATDSYGITLDGNGWGLDSIIADNTFINSHPTANYNPVQISNTAAGGAAAYTGIHHNVFNLFNKGTAITIDANAPGVTIGPNIYEACTNKIVDNSGVAVKTDTTDATNITSGTLPAARLPNTTVTPGSYTSADITVDASGRIISAANGSGGAIATPIDVFLIAGQSNAVGQGSSATSPVPKTGTAYQYYGGSISAAVDPIGPANTGSAWTSFAIEYFERTGRKVAFVPTAVSATALLHASQPTGNWSETGTLFNTSVTATQNALTAFTSAGYAPTFKGILWAQGETDADGINAGTSGVTKATYKTALSALVGRYQVAFPKTKLFVFQTGTRTDVSDSGYSQVRAAQQEVSNENPDVVLVFRNAINYSIRGLMADVYHYTQAGYNEMGRIGAQEVVSPNNEETLQLRKVDGVNPSIYVNDQGHVGIGSTSQPANLDVAGNIKTSGGRDAGAVSIVNGTFDTDLSGWGPAGGPSGSVSGWSWDSGTATHAAGANIGLWNVSGPTATVGGIYKIDFDIASSAGTLFVGFGYGNTSDVSGSGHRTFLVKSSSTAQLGVAPTSDFVGSIDNITVSEWSPPSISVGAVTADRPVIIDTTYNPLPVGNASLMISGDSNKERMELRSAGHVPGPVYQAKGASGTISAPSATQPGTTIAGLGGSGHDGAGWITGNRAGLFARAAELWSSTAQGTYWTFSTTPMTTTATAERMRITDSGNVGIGTTTPSHKLSVAGGISGQMASVNKAADATLTAEEVSNSILSNLGATALVTLTLPAAAAGYSFIATVSAAQELRLDPGASDTIYLNDEALTVEDGEYISLGSTIGTQVACYTAITGAGPAYDWFCRSIRGTVTEQD